MMMWVGHCLLPGGCRIPLRVNGPRLQAAGVIPSVRAVVEQVLPQVVVPVKYIQKGTNDSFVLVAEKGKALKKVIKISHEYNGLAEISEGLKEGDLLITEGYDLINEGDQINILK